MGPRTKRCLQVLGVVGVIALLPMGIVLFLGIVLPRIVLAFVFQPMWTATVFGILFIGLVYWCCCRRRASPDGPDGADPPEPRRAVFRVLDLLRGKRSKVAPRPEGPDPGTAETDVPRTTAAQKCVQCCKNCCRPKNLCKIFCGFIIFLLIGGQLSNPPPDPGTA
jgi:hypothetical protein